MEGADFSELHCFEQGLFDPACFPHREHVRLAHAFLGAYDFTEALARFTRGLRSMTTRAGRPDAFHATITTAFFSLVAEAMKAGGAAGFEDLVALRPDLLDCARLAPHYSQARLGSPTARAVFLLPDRAPANS